MNFLITKSQQLNAVKILEKEAFFVDILLHYLCVNITHLFSMIQNIRVAVDAIVFGYQNGKLYVLLIQQKFGTNETYWALPGGLVGNDEPLKEAVQRELKEETNVEVNYLEQLYTFGDDVYRDTRNRVI